MSSFIEDRTILTRAAPSPDATIRYGEVEEQIADLRYGFGTAEKQPLVVVIHGGYWRPQIDRKHTGPMCVAIAESGWTVASVEYRREPGNPDLTLEDISTCITRLPALTTRHNGKCIIVGHSAGGYLALWSAVMCTVPSRVGALALGPVADLDYAYANGLGDHAVQAFLNGSPNDRSNIDPTLMPEAPIAISIIHGEQDAVAPIAMSRNYVARHPKARLVSIEQCGHFALIDPASAAWASVIAELKMLSQ